MQQDLMMIFISSLAIILLLLFLLFEITATRHKRDEKKRAEALEAFAHDIKTPINTIVGFINGISDGTISAENTEKYLGTIQSECMRICRMTDDFLVSQKLGAPKITTESVNVYDMLSSVILAFEKDINDKSLEIKGLAEIDQSGAKDLVAQSDRELLHRALYNIVSNAVKYTPNGGEIGVKLKDSGETVTVSVSNTGESEADRLFDKGYRGNVEADGSGIGLYIVKSIAELSKGGVAARCENGETVIELTMPKD